MRDEVTNAAGTPPGLNMEGSMRPRRVAMNMTCNATFVVTLDDWTRVGFNGGQPDLSPQQWVDLHERLLEMTAAEACAYLDHTGWTRYGVEPAASTTDPWKHDRVEAALRFLTERLGNGSIDQEGRDIVTGILDGTLDENGRPINQANG